MRCSSPPRRRSARLALAILLPVLALLAGTPRAEAVSIYFTGPGGWGVLEAEARATGLPIFERAPDLLNPGELEISTPKFVTVDTKATSSGKRSDPATGTTHWELTNRALGSDNLWLVFYSRAPGDPNYPAGSISADQVGLEIGGPNWAFFNPRSAPEYFYPALFLGDMQIDAPVPTLALIQYQVLRDLELVRGSYMYPQFFVGVAGRANAPIPEPSSALLFAAGVLGLAALRRRRC